MKASLAMLLITAVLTVPAAAFADNPPDEDVQIQETSASDTAYSANNIGIDIYIGEHQNVIDSVARFNLFDSEGTLVGTKEEWIGGETDHIRLDFEVPQYYLGAEFTLGFVDGFRTLQYYDDIIAPGGSFTLGTYTYLDEAGVPAAGCSFALDADPYFDRGLNFYYNGKQIGLWPRGRIVDGIGMASAYDIGNALGVKVKYHPDYNSLTMAMGSNELIFNIGSEYATFFGNDLNISHIPFMEGDAVYVPIRDVLSAFGCTIDLWQGEDHIDVIAGESSVIKEFRARERVNREGITSKTNYLIWISKSNFEVKVYQGSRYNWECIRTAPCAIGAPGSPTIEGQFEYLYNGGTWTYPTFYVSPTMVFYGNYAIHSTLRAYGGGMYDDSVGVMISHGCVRIHPTDIDWMYRTIPIGTRVYVTP